MYILSTKGKETCVCLIVNNLIQLESFFYVSLNGGAFVRAMDWLLRTSLGCSTVLSVFWRVSLLRVIPGDHLQRRGKRKRREVLFKGKDCLVAFDKLEI